MPKIPLTRGLYALVDKRDFALLSQYRWQAHERQKSGIFEPTRHHRSELRNGKWRSISISMAQDIMGKRPGYIVDHENLNPLDNRRSNMRWATRSQNAVNWLRPNKYGARGVSLFRGRYFARITHAGRRMTLGAYKTVSQAADAYKKAARRLHGKFATTEISYV